MKNNKNLKKAVKKGINPIAAGVVGAAVTAAAAGTVVMLSDKKRRKRIAKTLNNVTNKGRQWASKANTVISNMQEKLEEVDKKIPGNRKKIAARV